MADFAKSDDAGVDSAPQKGAETTPTTESTEITYEHIPLSPKSHSLLPEFRAMFTEEMNRDLSDADCERFLIARNCDLQKAFDMISKYHTWYNTPLQGNIENPSLRPRDLGYQCTDSKEHLMASILEYAFTSCDRDGHPVYWEKSGQVAANFGKFKREFTDDEIIGRHIHMLEMMRVRCVNSSRRLNRPINKKIMVMDLTGIPVFPDWHLYRTLQKFEEIDQNYYPETLKTMIIINAPVYFTAIWAVIKPWMDPVTLTKVYICGNDCLSTLRIHMDDDMIPVEYGGTREPFSWTWPTCFED